MAETEANAAHGVDEDGKTAEDKPTEPEQPADKSSEQPEVSAEANSKDTVNKEEVVADGAEAGAAAAAAEEPAADSAPATETTEGTAAAETKTSLLDSFLNKSGLGKVMAGRKKKEPSTTSGAEEGAAEGGEKSEEKSEEKSAEKSGEEAEAPAAEGQAAAEKEPDSSEKEDDKKEKSKATEAKSAVRDFIRKPVARIFSHRSAEKKDGTSGEQKPVKVRSKSLDRIEDAEALNTTDPSTEEGAAGGAEDDTELKASSAQAKHMKRWHSFKKMMAQKTHKKSSGGGEEDGEGAGGDSSTLDSKESGQKRWKLKRSWTFQGLKRDSSVVGISSKAKSSDKEATDGAKGEEEAQEAEGDEAKAEGAEGPAAEGGEEEKSAAAGVGAVTQHANEIWTSFKKRVIPKSKRTNTECAPAEEDGAAGEEGSSEEGKDGKSAKAKRSHFGRAVSLKNFILRKGKSTSVDMGEGAKEEEGAPDGEEAEANAEPAADGEAAPTAETGSTEPTDTEAPAQGQADEAKNPTEKATSEEKSAEDAPVTNGENGCSNGHEDSAAHNHQEEDKSSPIKKTKVSGGAMDETNAKIINTTAPCNSGESQQILRQGAGPDCDSGQGGSEIGQDSRAEEEDVGRRKGEIRDAAVALVQNVMSAAAHQLERELCTSNGLHSQAFE